MAAFGRPPDEYPPEQSTQGNLRPPAEPPQADKAAIGSMARGALSCLVVARWGLHGSEGCPFVSPQADMAGIPFQGESFLGPAGARWGPFVYLANEISGLRRCRRAVIWDGIQYPAVNWQYPVADREEISGPGRRSAKYGARTMKFMCFWRH